MSLEPNYESYSNSELLDVYENIDRNNYSDRFHKLCEIMEHKGLLIKTEPSSLELTDKAFIESDIFDRESEPSYTDLPPEPQYDSERNYIPNEIPLKTRITNAFFSMGIIFYGGYGLHINELWVPLSKRTSIVLTNTSAVLMFFAILCLSVMMLAEVVDHYDKRDNEHIYYKVALYSKYIGYAAFGVAILVGLAMGAKMD